MRIDLSQIDREQFHLKEGAFCGFAAVLVTPALAGTKWTQANKHLRSSVWSLDGELLSAGLPKFTNAGENPEHFPMPASLDHAVCVEKLDGSLAIFDLVNGQLSCRTRGTFTSDTLDNAADFRHAMAKYPGIAQWLEHVPNVSVLCEITTPNQRIVVDYGPEVELTLIGAVNKTQEYRLLGQDVLDSMAISYQLRRPRYFTFKSLDHCLADVATWKGLEGCVIYNRPDGMWKVKCSEYLRLHRLKSEIGSLSKLLDLYFALGAPYYGVVREHIEKELDYELAQQAEPDLKRIQIARNAVECEIAQITADIAPYRDKPRKEAAAFIIGEYGDTPWRGLAFTLLTHGETNPKQLRALMEFCLDSVANPVTVTPMPRTLTDVAGLTPEAFANHLKVCPPDVSPESWEPLHDADPKCVHDIVDAPGGGVKCGKCAGWFCY